MSKDVLYKYGRYEVRVCDNVEDGDQRTVGYGVFNTETGVREHSNLILRNCLNLARHLEQGVRELMAVKDTPEDDMFERDPNNLRPLN